jgi:hypothetical protein
VARARPLARASASRGSDSSGPPCSVSSARARATPAAPGEAAACSTGVGVAGASNGDLPGRCCSRPRSPRSLVVVPLNTDTEVGTDFRSPARAAARVGRSPLKRLRMNVPAYRSDGGESVVGAFGAFGALAVGWEARNLY